MTEDIMTQEVFAKRIFDLPPALHGVFAELADFCTDALASDDMEADFVALENDTVAAVRKTGLGILRTCIEQRDDGARSIRREGRSWYRLARSRGSLTCLLGHLGYDRPRYRNDGVRNSLCPVDESLGLLSGSMTRPAGKLAMRLVAELPCRTSSILLREAGGMDPSVSTLQRVLGEAHWAWQDVEEEAFAELRSGERVPDEATSVALSLDGAMVLLRSGEDPASGGDDRRCGSSNWREASCGTLSFHDETGGTLRTISSGRMPEKGKMALKHWLVREFEEVMRDRPDLTCVGVADGAPDNWTFLSRQALDVEVLDFYHAATHLRTASEHAASPERWYEHWRHVLRHDMCGANRVIAAIRGLRDRARDDCSRSELTVVLGYFRTHRHRMNYAELSGRGIPIGSGIVEAANKTHIGERLKKSGMRWGIAGGQAVLTFRSLLRSDRFDGAWNKIMVAIDNRKPDNDNWKPFYEKKKTA